MRREVIPCRLPDCALDVLRRVHKINAHSRCLAYVVYARGVLRVLRADAAPANPRGLVGVYNDEAGLSLIHGDLLQAAKEAEGDYGLGQVGAAARAGAGRRVR